MKARSTGETNPVSAHFSRSEQSASAVRPSLSALGRASAINRPKDSDCDLLGHHSRAHPVTEKSRVQSTLVRSGPFHRRKPGEDSAATGCSFALSVALSVVSLQTPLTICRLIYCRLINPVPPRHGRPYDLGEPSSFFCFTSWFTGAVGNPVAFASPSGQPFSHRALASSARWSSSAHARTRGAIQ